MPPTPPVGAHAPCPPSSCWDSARSPSPPVQGLLACGKLAAAATAFALEECGRRNMLHTFTGGRAGPWGSFVQHRSSPRRLHQLLSSCSPEGLPGVAHPCCRSSLPPSPNSTPLQPTP